MAVCATGLARCVCFDFVANTKRELPAKFVKATEEYEKTHKMQIESPIKAKL